MAKFSMWWVDLTWNCRTSLVCGWTSSLGTPKGRRVHLVSSPLHVCSNFAIPSLALHQDQSFIPLVPVLFHHSQHLSTMLGGFSSNNPTASFAPATPPAPRTPSEWKASLLEVKRLYLGRQYKQSAARSLEILKRSTEPVCHAYPSTHPDVSD